MRPVTTILAMAGILLLVLPGRPAAQARATLRASIELVTVDLVVRDQSGAPVGGLAQEDFEVREDGVPQRVTMFEAPGGGRPGPGDPALPRTITATAAAADAAQVATPSLGAMIFVFDLAAMRPDEVDRAVDAAARYVEQAPAGGLLFGVATIGADLEWLAGLTLDRDAIAEALVDVSPVSGFAAESPEPRTLATDERAAFRIDDGEGRGDEAGAMAAGPDDLAVLTNDRRLRALTRLARSLESVGRKKAVLYFSGGLATSGLDNGVEIRAAVNAAVRANVAFYPVDAAGLRTVTPGGDVTRSPPSDVGLFSGGDVRRQYDDLARAQETLLTLAADTGGRAVLDTNDFRGAFTRAAEDLSTYYLLGYQSTNPARDGRFRRLQVRVRRPGLRVEARAGYYTDLDFAHATRADREAQLAAELAAPMPSTDLPVIVGAAWYRLSAEEYDVPLAVAVPGWEVAAPAGAAVIPLDVLGEIRDEDDRPVGRLRQTASVPLAGPLKLADVLLVYRTRLRLPPGRFTLKLVVRENVGGRLGSFETPLVVPDLVRRPLEASAVVLRAGDVAAPAARWPPHPTRVVARDQDLRFYVEVYDPAVAPNRPASVRAGLTCYRGDRLVLETRLDARSGFDAVRRALPITIALPPGALPAGVHTCQVNVIDDVARRFTFPRVTFVVR